MIGARRPMKEFIPHPLLHNAHAMTLAATLLPRRTRRLPPAQERLFEVEAGTQLLAKCHWQAQPRERPTLVLIHGLEGSSESPYMRTLAERAFLAGFNALRLNQRNCGGSEALTSTLYNSGLSGDYRAVLVELIVRDKLPAIFFAGYSMGGNLAFKMAGELGAAAPRELRAVCGVCPTLDLAACVDAVAAPRNFIYEWHFVRALKSRMRRKARRFPGRYDLQGMDGLRTLREFDDAITAPYSGYRDAEDYYRRASAVRVVGQIATPHAAGDRAGRSLCPGGFVSRAGNRTQSGDPLFGAGARRALRFYLQFEWSRALLGGGARGGVLHASRGADGNAGDPGRLGTELPSSGGIIRCGRRRATVP